MKKIAVLISALALLSACSKDEGHTLKTSGDSIIGGEAVTATDPIAQKVAAIYISMGMGDGGTQICTGSAIHPRVILTAAHCIAKPHSFVDIKVTAPDGIEDTFVAVNEKSHPDFKMDGKSPTDRNADVALLFLDHDLPKYFKVMKLAPANKDLHVNNIIAAGFGQTSGIANKPGTIGELRKTVLNVTYYNPSRGLFIEVDQSQGKGLCTGDSGGPGFIQRDGQDYIVGIVKGGKPADQPGIERADQDRCNGKGYFTNLQLRSNLNWVRSTMVDFLETLPK